MKRLHKFMFGLLLTGAFLFLMGYNVSAQHGSGSRGGSGSGGVRAGGGGVGYHGSGFGTSVRGNPTSGTGTRVGDGGGLNYRGGSGYFAGTGYHGGAFYRPGFGYYSYPHLGFYLGVLPFGYYPFYWGSSLYYYYDGIFYSPYDNGGYQVTAPPIGAGVPDLPENAESIKIDGIQYYQADGVYYKTSVNDKGKKMYVVAGKDGVLNTDERVTDPNATLASPRVGDMVNQLPDDCRKVLLNGKKYYLSPNGIYYEKVKDPNGNVAFRIASLPDDEGDINGA